MKKIIYLKKLKKNGQPPKKWLFDYILGPSFIKVTKKSDQYALSKFPNCRF
jgi:hypothetical protein